MSFGVMPSPGGKPAPRPRAPAPKVQVPPVSIGRGPAPLPPRMQPPRPAPMPPRMQPPMPAPMPELPYGGPINMPGGPFTPRPDLGPGVGFGPGLPSPNPAPIQGMPTPGIGDGKASDMGRLAGNMLGQGIPNMFGGNQQNMPSPGVLPPGFDDTFTGGPQLIGGAYGQPIYGGQPSPMPPSMYSQPQPNFANALGTQSPFLNTVQR